MHDPFEDAGFIEGGDLPPWGYHVIHNWNTRVFDPPGSEREWNKGFYEIKVDGVLYRDIFYIDTEKGRIQHYYRKANGEYATAPNGELLQSSLIHGKITILYTPF